jgi:uncharacterized glyoxalase superfamily protein PhnB
MPIVPNVFYRDPRAALLWLERAFGFRTTLIMEDATGNVGHSEVSFRGGTVNVGGEWSEWARSPASVDGVTTQQVMVELEAALDLHYRWAREAGAVILQEPEAGADGLRAYTARDPEGHVWSFRQTNAGSGRTDDADEDDASPFSSRLCYRDPSAALGWLKAAFGLAVEGETLHSGDSYITVAAESALERSPTSIGGVNTQTIEVEFYGDIDAHCARARTAGAAILEEPADQFYGWRTYRARDLEGHVWTFSKHVRDVSPEEMESASGLKMWTLL